MKTQVERLTRVRNALYNTPWAIMPDALEALCQIFERSLLAEKAEFDVAAAAAKFHGEREYTPRGAYPVVNGVAKIGIVGPIFPRANLMTTSGATSLEESMRQFSDALGNAAVNAILMEFDTPGGNAMGLDEAATQIFDARSQSKPVIAIANSMACSAGYYLASQAMEFYATSAAVIGSIGVRMIAESDARQRLNEGIDIEYAYVSGPLKGGVGPMTESQKAELDQIGETFFDKFKSAVARARPGLDVEQVATGAVWIGSQAVSLGLCDGVSTMDAQLKRLAA